MRRIKLIASDFHLGTGRRNEDGSLNTLEDFIFDERFIEFLEYYSTGDYTNAEVELILNGDFFNMIQTPVDGLVPTDVTEEISLRQLARIVDGHPQVVAALQAFREREGKRLVFTVGNHDAGLAWPAVKERIREIFGRDVEVVSRAYVFDNIHVEHGDRYEPVHYVDPRLPFLSKGLEKSILNLPWATFFYIRFVLPFKKHRNYVSFVKPFRNYLIWAAVHDFWIFVRTISGLTMFTILSLIFGRIGNRRFGWPTAMRMLRQVKGNPELHAARRILKRADTRMVIFGHTHHPLYRRFAPNQEYLNTGCWNQMINLDIAHLGYQEVFTYAKLEWNGRRWLASLKHWKGQTHPTEDFFG